MNSSPPHVLSWLRLCILQHTLARVEDLLFSSLRRLLSTLAQHSPCNLSASWFYALRTASVGARNSGQCVYHGQHMVSVELLVLAAL